VQAKVCGWNDPLWPWVVLQSAQNLVRSQVFAHAREMVGFLMLGGAAVLTWGTVAHYYDSGRPSED